MSELNNRYFADINSSIYNLRQLYNKYIQDVARYNADNVLKNPLLREYYVNGSGDRVYYGWNTSGNINLNNITYNSIATQIQFVGANSILSQRFEDNVYSGEYYTFYLKIKTDNQLTIRIKSDSGAILDYQDLVSDGSATYTLNASGDYQEVIHHFFVKTSEILSGDDISIEIENTNANTTVFIARQYVVTGLVQNLQPVSFEKFIENAFRYNTTSGKWEFTNDGTTYHEVASVNDINVIVNDQCCLESWF